MIINLFNQHSLVMPNQALTSNPYGNPLSQHDVVMSATVYDLTTGSYLCTDTSVTASQIGIASISDNRRWYEVPLTSFGGTPAGAPAGIGQFRPGHQYVAHFAPVVGQTQFSEFNYGPFGCKDSRDQLKTWPSKIVELGSAQIYQVWENNGWRYRRDFAGDGKWGSVTYLITSDGSNDDSVAGFDRSMGHTSGDPSAIRYQINATARIPFDGYACTTTGYAGVIDGTPWIGLSPLTPVMSLYDVGAGFEPIPTTASTMTLVCKAWYMLSTDFDPSNFSLNGMYKTDTQVAVEVKTLEDSSLISGYGAYITVSAESYDSLPYRYAWRNTVMYKEYASPDAPAEWNTDPYNAAYLQYTIARQSVKTNDGFAPTSQIMNYWNLIDIRLGDLEII